MPKYLIERQFEVTAEKMPEIGRRSKQIIVEQFPQIQWEHSHVVVDESGNAKTYCVYEAPSIDVVRQHGDQLGFHDIIAIYEVAGDVTPDDFPLN
jgi:hypothetical protein